MRVNRTLARVTSVRCYKKHNNNKMKLELPVFSTVSMQNLYYIVREESTF